MVEPSFWNYFWIIFIIGLLLSSLYIIKRFNFKVGSFVDTKNIKLVEYSNLGEGVKALLLETHGKKYMCIVTRNSCSNLIRVEGNTDRPMEGHD